VDISDAQHAFCWALSQQGMKMVQPTELFRASGSCEAMIGHAPAPPEAHILQLSVAYAACLPRRRGSDT
jgi:hypothetical protein